jgi:hypothetical protein
MVFMMALRQGCIEYDSSNFLGGFKKFCNKTIPDVATKGLFQTGWMVIRYANTKKPKTPRDKSDLQSSGRVEVHPVKLEITVGFNKEYAAKLHEMPKARKVNWTLPGSGRKYLETKLYHYNKDFNDFMGGFISKAAFK